MSETVKQIKKLLPLLKIYPWLIPIIVLLGILASCSEGIGLSLFIPLLETLNSDRSQTSIGISFLDNLNGLLVGFSQEQRILLIALGIFISIFIKNLLVYLNNIVFSWFDSRIGEWLRNKIFQQYLYVSYSYLETKESGKLMNTLSTETWRATQALSILVYLIIHSCTVIIFTSLLLLISWQLTISVVAGLSLISVIIQLVTRKVKTLGQQAVESNKNLATRMWEGFSGMKVIRSFGREKYEQNRFAIASEKVRDSFFKLDIISRTVNPLSEVLSSALILLVMAVALYRDTTSFPLLLTFLFTLYRLQPKVKQLDNGRVGLASLVGSVEDVMSLIETKDKPYISSGTRKFLGLQKEIRLESVSFKYDNDSFDNWAVRDISLSIPKGKTIAFVGSSGAGKSTLIGLICRFYEVTKGEIYLDGYPLREFELNSWRNRLAVVSQDIYLFSNTIRENIAYGRLNATDAEIIEAAKLANAHQFISQLPNGYDTTIGDRGMRLSGGQRQRIALARAIVRKPEILILDEATNALDSISENLIQEALDTLSKNCTVIAIAHRLSTIEKADRIVVLDEGKIVEQGSFSELLKQPGLFSKLYSLQYRNVEIINN